MIKLLSSYIRDVFILWALIPMFKVKRDLQWYIVYQRNERKLDH